ncbi:helix-turn-helix domain-containing protein [Nocardia tengchongensis]|uniref:Helix-turn-helix domain-containing protein n=1 Tax=Nocardia tengchongensis TaxID=2055889 RepID=A0ABX8CKH4_9NOCA|nr:helix-turn-helix domain-containing protein [Nocardia tengchongensis]
MVSFLAAHPDRSFSLSELARAAEITTATCHAILVSLVEAGWVTRTDLTYGLGPAMLAIGRAARPGIRWPGRPHRSWPVLPPRRDSPPGCRCSMGSRSCWSTPWGRVPRS